ncbi:MAG: hypothetical protein V4623_06705 [Pseudomonadota bacterium]
MTCPFQPPASSCFPLFLKSQIQAGRTVVLQITPEIGNLIPVRKRLAIRRLLREQRRDVLIGQAEQLLALAEAVLIPIKFMSIFSVPSEKDQGK